MQPTFTGDGTTPRLSDPRNTIWKKILGALQNRPGALPANNPRLNDTQWTLREKINKSLTGNS